MGVKKNQNMKYINYLQKNKNQGIALKLFPLNEFKFNPNLSAINIIQGTEKKPTINTIKYIGQILRILFYIKIFYIYIIKIFFLFQ